MSVTSVQCSVLGTTVTQVTDAEADATKILCSEYEEPTGICLVKERARRGRVWSRLLALVGSRPPAGDIQCDWW